MADKRLITWRTLKKCCSDYITSPTGNFCLDLPDGRDACKKKACPIWKRLTKAKEGK